MSVIRRGACAVALCMLALGSGCDKKKEAAAPAAGGMPALDQPPAGAGKPGDRPVHEPTTGAEGAGNLPAGHPPIMPGSSGAGGMAPGGMGAGHGTPGFDGTTPGGDFDPKTVVAGVIKLDGAMKSKVAAGDTIFVVARRYEEGATGPGTPLAVKKLIAGKWPLEFSLDSRDAMLAGTKLSGKVIVTVRVDKDGDAITKNPGDVIGQSKPVEPPQKNLVVALDKTL
ncbi:MAG: hypothetical protein JWN44_4270 [Myxococcales bacterium]|nr:hypothetical protein [Myxococcales bacterium]